MLGCLLSGGLGLWNAGVLDEGDFSFLQEADTGTQPAGSKVCAFSAERLASPWAANAPVASAVYCRCMFGLDLQNVLGIVSRIFTNLKMFTIWPYLLFHLHLFSFLLCGTNRANVLSVFILRPWLSWPGQPHACSCLSLPNSCDCRCSP